MAYVRSLLMICAVVLAAPGAYAAAPKPAEPTICEIIEHPRRFEGRTVRVQASLLGEFHHGYILVESGCRGGLEFKTPGDDLEGDSPLARWNRFMWPVRPAGFPFPDLDWDSEVDSDLELVGVIRFYEKDVDDRSGSNWAAKSRFGPSRGTRPVPYIDVTTVESARFYRLTRPRYEMDR